MELRILGLNKKGLDCLKVTGDLTIGSIGALYTELQSSLVRGANIKIAVEDDADFDLTLIQLILSARRTAAELNCHLALAQPASGALRAMLERGGFVPQDDAESRAFWLHEETQ